MYGGLTLYSKEGPDALVYVSVAVFARMEVGEHLLLSRNKKSFEEGRTVYTPLGGAVEVTDFSEGFLEEHLKNIGAKLRKGNDLRFDIPQGRLDEIIVVMKEFSDFHHGTKVALYRELREELVDEFRLLQDLPLRMLRSSFMQTVNVREEEGRDGTPERVQRVYVVYGVEIEDPAYKGSILDGLSDNRLMIATPKEIEDCGARGKQIGRNSWAILKNAEELYRRSPTSDPQAVSVEYLEKKLSH